VWLPCVLVAPDAASRHNGGCKPTPVRSTFFALTASPQLDSIENHRIGRFECNRRTCRVSGLLSPSLPAHHIGITNTRFLSEAKRVSGSGFGGSTIEQRTKAKHPLSNPPGPPEATSVLLTLHTAPSFCPLQPLSERFINVHLNVAHQLCRSFLSSSSRTPADRCAC
jgi:hypothetical protein